MPLKYAPAHDEEASSIPPVVWAIVCLALLAGIGYFIYKANQTPPEITFTPSPPPTPAPRLAKEGTFFVLEYISVRTKSGIIGFEPGHEVHFVQALQEKQKLLVSDGQYQTEVGPSQLTNDLDVAALAQARDTASQNQLAAHQAAEKAVYDKSRHEADLAHSKDVAQVNARISAAPGIGVDNPLNAAPKSTKTVVRANGNPYSYFPAYPQRAAPTP